MEEKTSTKISFFLAGTFPCILFVAVIAGAQDILTETHIPTSTILMSDVLPFFLVSLFFPYIARKIPYIARVTTVVLLYVIAFSLLGFAGLVNLKVLGVIIASLGTGILSVSLLGLSTYFQPEVLSWFSTATGMGNLIGLIYYTG